MSRVLVEAASVGTPVVVNDYGLLGHLVREHGIGRAVDRRDAGALRAAITTFTGSPAAVAAHQPALRAFAERYSEAAFGAALDRVYPAAA
jgi:glycosyltransferase involved in cell wall biosynthesis